MGRIPEFRTGGVARTSQLIDTNAPLRQARIIQNAVQNVGQAVDNAFQAADNTFILENETKFKKDQIELQRELEQKYQSNPTDPKLFDEFKQKSQERIDEFAKGLNRPQAQNAFRRLAENQQLRTSEQLESFKLRQTQENLLASNNETVKNLRDISLADPSVRGALTSLERIDALKTTNAPTLGDKNTERLYQQQQRQVADSYIAANFANEDEAKGIRGVKDLLKQDKIKKALGAEGVERARNKIRRYEEMQKRRARKRELSKNKPWRYLEKVNELDNLTRLDLTDAKTFVERQEFISAMEKKHGLNMDGIPVAPFEVENLKNFILTSNIDNMTGTLQQLDDGVDDNFLRTFGKQIFSKEPEVGSALALYSESPEVATDILKGFRRVQSKSLEIDSQNIETMIDEQLANVIDNDQARSLLKRSIKAHAVNRVFESGENLKTGFDSDIIKDSIAEVIGPIIKPTGFRFGFGSDFQTAEAGVVSFRKSDGEFADRDEFDGLLKSLTPERLKENLTNYPVDDEGNVIDVGSFIDRYIVRSIGAGTYQLSTPGGMILYDQNDRPFILNLQEYERNLTNREESDVNP